MQLVERFVCHVAELCMALALHTHATIMRKCRTNRSDQCQDIIFANCLENTWSNGNYPLFNLFPQNLDEKNYDKYQ